MIRILVKRGLVLSLNGFITSSDRPVVLHDHFRQLMSSLHDGLVSGREIVQFGWENPATRIIIDDQGPAAPTIRKPCLRWLCNFQLHSCAQSGTTGKPSLDAVELQGAIGHAGKSVSNRSEFTSLGTA